MTRNKRAALAVVVLALAGSIAALTAFSASTHASALPTPHPTLDSYRSSRPARRRQRRRTALRSPLPASRPRRFSRRTTSARSMPTAGPARASRLRSSTRTAATRWRTTCTSSTRLSVFSRCAAKRASRARPGMPKFSELLASGLAGDEGAAGHPSAPGQEDKSGVGARGRARRRDLARDCTRRQHPARPHADRGDARRAGLPADDDGRGLRRRPTISPT